MEGDHQEISNAAHIRRRRRVGRSMREKTPDPSARRMSSTEDDSSIVGGGTTVSEGAQVVSMQIRPPRSTMSAHESKILRRRDKTFATAATRSLSQPREAERLSEPEATELIKTVKRSLSMPRNKEVAESSEGELQARGRTLSPETRLVSAPIQSTADENLSRLEQNLKRFENERKRFESEKKLFEREKREHKLRYKQMLDNEERKRLLQSYRKLSDRIKLPQGEEERKRLIHSLRLERPEGNLPTSRSAAKRNRHSGNFEESSTQFSSSDTETAEEIQARHLAKQLSPVRRYHSAMTTASVRGPPPQPPARQSASRNNSLSPVRPQRQSASRNNSLSPVRPQRRSKTPEQRAEIMKKLNGLEEQQREEQQSLRPETTTTTEFETDRETHLRHRKAHRSESLHRPEAKRKQSLETSQDKVDSSMPIEIAKEIQPEIIISPAKDNAETVTTKEQKPSFLQKLGQLFRKSPKPETLTKEQEDLLPPTTEKQDAPEIPDKIISKAFLKAFLRDARQQWRTYKAERPQDIKEIKRMRNRCFAHTIMLILLLGFGGLMFRYTEGTSENIYKCEVRKVKRDFIDHLWSHSHSMREEDWKSLARQKLRKFEEELHTMGEMGIRYFPGQKSWNFVNCILYCWTVITTIGYGHITPKTRFGQSLTIAYAIIGIPMFLILLADFGKLFTRAIKFIWGYVRRLYYTGTCRSIRKQQQVRDAMTGFSTVYDMAIRRPSHFFGMGPDTDVESQASEAGKSHPETPTSPYPETIVVDDEFNLPISLASILLITYILLGTFVYTLWEDWTYFEAFYFVFISMSTIGFGDLVPNHPIFMMCSIIYLVFGLALTSMFINVVQIKLSDTFKDASAKIGATLGVGVASELGDEASQAKTPSELASVHGSRLDKIAEDENEELSSASPPLQSILRPSRPSSPANQEEQSNGEVGPPPLLPRRQLSVEQPPAVEKKKKRRFFK
ncbi:uncharacterized protein LOC119612875 [Lucilia sericata]|uniref:uncharacterized protein LOC119612875 n=1 Tax=Lucilia sericata TaxID=13632 RepID=UPI0018A7F33A|nr:uncharacterized protein LOC119612875 [Lucilia sericata]XP_037824688.1 uncharacterized protein LOC119612875 [Lucilia sericata]